MDSYLSKATRVTKDDLQRIIFDDPRVICEVEELRAMQADGYEIVENVEIIDPTIPYPKYYEHLIRYKGQLYIAAIRYDWPEVNIELAGRTFTIKPIPEDRSMMIRYDGACVCDIYAPDDDDIVAIGIGVQTSDTQYGNPHIGIDSVCLHVFLDREPDPFVDVEDGADT